MEGEEDQIITPSTNSTDQSTDASTEATTASTEAPVVTTAAPVTDIGYVNATTMHIRSGPGTDYGAIGGLKMGDQVKILGKEGDWYKIEFKETGGYVSAQFIQGLAGGRRRDDNRRGYSRAYHHRGSSGIRTVGKGHIKEPKKYSLRYSSDSFCFL